MTTRQKLRELEKALGFITPRNQIVKAARTKPTSGRRKRKERSDYIYRRIMNRHYPDPSDECPF
jgi:hypothetical protein